MRKGLHVLVDAFKICREFGMDIELRIAGLESYIGEDIEGSRMLGKLNSEEIKKEFLSADVFVLPTISEGMAGVAIEALAAG